METNDSTQNKRGTSATRKVTRMLVPNPCKGLIAKRCSSGKFQSKCFARKCDIKITPRFLTDAEGLTVESPIWNSNLLIFANHFGSRIRRS